MEVFWERGYEAASAADLVAATGLNKSSLYNTFGSKDRLFAAALERYLDRRVEMMTEVVGDGAGGIDAVVALFETMRGELDGPAGHLGCLAINSSTELAPRDAEMVAVSRSYREAIRSVLVSALTAAAAAGQIDDEAIEHHAAVLLGMVMSIAVIARSGADRSEVSAQIDAAIDLAESWRR